MKKGDARFLLSVIIPLLVIIALVLVSTTLFNAINRDQGDLTCRKCIEFSNSVPDVAQKKCECSPEELHVTFAQVTSDGTTVDQDKARKIVADGMARCLRKFHDGDLDPVADFPDLKDTAICRPCFTITFDSKLQRVMDDGLAELDDIPLGEDDDNLRKRAAVYSQYSITNPTPYLTRKLDPRNINSETYWEYLFKETTPELPVSTVGFEQAALLDGSTIMVRYGRDSDAFFERIVGAAGAGAMIVAGGILIVGTGGLATPLVIAAGGAVATGYGLVNLASERLSETSATTTASDIETLQTFLVAYPDKNSFKNCANCENSAGGVVILPPDFDYTTKWVLPDIQEEWPVCSVVI